MPIALPGDRIAGDQYEKTRVRQVRGVRSHGELLSTDELGWTVGGPDEVHALPTNLHHGL